MVFEFNGKRPRIGKNVFIAPTATVVGDVEIGDGASIWYGTVVRGDSNYVKIGKNTNIQDNSVVHVDPDAPNIIGSDVTIGHGALVHGVEVEDYVLIGMGAIVLGGSKVGEGSIVGAGALVLENTVIPPYSLVVGSPARVVRTLDPEERRPKAIRHAVHYVEQARRHASDHWDGQVEA